MGANDVDPDLKASSAFWLRYMQGRFSSRLGFMQTSCMHDAHAPYILATLPRSGVCGSNLSYIQSLPRTFRAVTVTDRFENAQRKADIGSLWLPFSRASSTTKETCGNCSVGRRHNERPFFSMINLDRNLNSTMQTQTRCMRQHNKYSQVNRLAHLSTKLGHNQRLLFSYTKRVYCLSKL